MLDILVVEFKSTLLSWSLTKNDLDELFIFNLKLESMKAIIALKFDQLWPWAISLSFLFLMIFMFLQVWTL